MAWRLHISRDTWLFISTLSHVAQLNTTSSVCCVGGIEGPRNFEFDNALQGNDIPPEFHSAIEKGFIEAANSGSLIGAPVEVHTGTPDDPVGWIYYCLGSRSWIHVRIYI